MPVFTEFVSGAYAVGFALLTKLGAITAWIYTTNGVARIETNRDEVNDDVSHHCVCPCL